MRWIALLLALPLLGACNLVVTADPTFTAADAAGAPALREGLWVSEEANCRFDSRKPVQKWPRCASWYLVRGGEFQTFGKGDKGEPPGWTSMPYVLAAGEPRIMQLDLTGSNAGDSEPQPLFVYLGLAPTAWDEAGRITAEQSWLVQCGPPPLDAKGKPDPLAVTDRPFPGLIVNTGSDPKHGATCTPRDVQALRNAAVASRTLEPPTANRWVRDSLP